MQDLNQQFQENQTEQELDKIDQRVAQRGTCAQRLPEYDQGAVQIGHGDADNIRNRICDFIAHPMQK